MSQRVDFSGNANVYDRRHGAVLAEDVVERLTVGAELQPGASIIDIGAGTGRASIPFAERGFDVIAVEPALGMVDALRAKAGDTPMRVIAGEGAMLPLSAGGADVVIIARLLYLTPDWRGILREAHRVLAPGGRLLHEWANGQPDEEWVRIREKARMLFEEAGVESPFHPGVRSEGEVDEFLRGLGFLHGASLSIGPGPAFALAEFLRRLVEGELSYIWSVPKEVQDDCLPRLRSWAQETFDLEVVIPMPRHLHWTVYRKGNT